VLTYCCALLYRETKARQWARPAKEARAVESAAASSVAVEDEDGLISFVLPPGWKELVDKKTGRMYYVNRCVTWIS
jgi:hypothetical protein